MAESFQSVQCHNFHFKEEVVFLCQNIFYTGQLSHLFSLARLAIPLSLQI